MTRYLPLLLLLTGCAGSDFVLHNAPPPERDADPLVIDGAPAGAVTDDASPSMWDDLSGLEIPDEYWLVNWVPKSGPCEGGGCWQPRTDVIDVLGRVIASFAWPTWTEGEVVLGAGDFDVLEATAGPAGTALLTARPRSSEAWELGHERYVWRADAVGVNAQFLFAIDHDGTVHLPTVGAKFPTGQPVYDARVVPDPTDPDVVWVLAMDSVYSDVGGASVIEVDLGGGAPRVWSVAKSVDVALTRIFSLQAIPTDDGTALLLGIEGQFDDGPEPAWASRLITLAPDGTRLGHDLDVSAEGWFDGAGVAEGTTSLQDVTVLLQSGGAMYGYGYCGFEPLRVVDRDSVVQIPTTDADACFGGGLLLDAAGPTLLFGSSSTPGDYYVPPAEQLVVHHRGEAVHRIETIRSGLAEYGFELIALARLRL